MRKHAERFKMKLAGEDTFSNVYIEDGLYVIDSYRAYRSAKDLLESELHSRALGKQLRKEAREGYAVLEGMEVVDAVDLAFLSRYFKK
nr:hypothetical protein IAMNGHCI_00001 [Methanosarcinales archaeon ANME-2c ERB4]